MRRLTTLALAAAAALLLGSCGGGGGDGGVVTEPEETTEAGLSQEQTQELLLTEEEFPVEGWTRGEVEEVDLEELAGDGEGFQDIFGDAEGIPEACVEALGSVDDLETESVQAGSTVSFAGPEGNGFMPAEAELVLASLNGGESPLGPLAEVNEHCTDLEVTQDGLTVNLSFSELDELEGTKMTMTLSGLDVEMIMAGRTEGATVVALMATGLDEGQVKEVIDAQYAKVSDAG